MRLATLLLLVTAACGHERATILAIRVTSGQANAQEPLKGADGALDCPGQMLPQDLGESNQDGDLRAQHVGAVPLACVVTISMAGFQPYRAAVQDICATRTDGGCRTVDLRVALAPVPAKAGSGSK